MTCREPEAVDHWHDDEHPSMEPVYPWVRDRPRTRWERLAWIGLGLALIAGGVLAVVATPGCTLPWSLGGPKPANPGLPPVTIWTDPRAMLGLLGGLCALGAVVLTVLAFTPFGKLIPKGAALGAVAAAIGCWFVQRYFGAIMWVALAAAVVAAVALCWPLIGAAHRWGLARLSNRLDAGGHKDAAGALLAASRGLTSDKQSHKDKRAALLPAGAAP